MLSNEQCKKILSKEGFFYTEEGIKLIKETLYKLVEIIEENKINNKKIKKYEERNNIHESKYR